MFPNKESVDPLQDTPVGALTYTVYFSSSVNLFGRGALFLLAFFIGCIVTSWAWEALRFMFRNNLAVIPISFRFYTRVSRNSPSFLLWYGLWTRTKGSRVILTAPLSHPHSDTDCVITLDPEYLTRHYVIL